MRLLIQATWLELRARWHYWRHARTDRAARKHLAALRSFRYQADQLAQCQAQYWPKGAPSAWRCTKPTCHDGKHGYAGVFW